MFKAKEKKWMFASTGLSNPSGKIVIPYVWILNDQATGESMATWRIRTAFSKSRWYSFYGPSHIHRRGISLPFHPSMLNVDFRRCDRRLWKIAGGCRNGVFSKTEWGRGGDVPSLQRVCSDFLIPFVDNNVDNCVALRKSSFSHHLSGEDEENVFYGDGVKADITEYIPRISWGGEPNAWKWSSGFSVSISMILVKGGDFERKGKYPVDRHRFFE